MTTFRSNILPMVAILALLGAMAGLVMSASLASAESGGPTVVLSGMASTTTSNSSVAITATFSEDVTGFTVGDIVETNSTVSNFATTSSSVYTFNVNPSADGTVTVNVPADMAIGVNPPTKTNQESNTITFTYASSSPADATAPTISNVVVSGITTTGATVTWTTSEPATGQVAYGTTSSYGSLTTLDSSLGTSQSATITGLGTSTIYHFQIRSADASANMATTSDATFTTAQATSTSTSTPLAVVSITPIQTSATANGTFENGWSWIMRLTVPQNEDAFRMKFTDWTGSAGTFQADNNVRIYSAQSSNANSPATAIISPDNNYGGWMYLSGDADAITAGRQIDVTIGVRIPVGTAAGSYTTTFTANSTPGTATSTTP